MASRQTIKKTLRMIGRFAKSFPILQLPPGVMFNSENKAVPLKGSGELYEELKGPTAATPIWRELAGETVRKFLRFTSTPEPKPTQQEWQEFEHKLLTAIRRATIRETREKVRELSKGLPEPLKKARGRPRRDPRKIELVQATVKKHMQAGMSKTESVRKTKEEFGLYSEDTVWRYLRIRRMKSYRG